VFTGDAGEVAFAFLGAIEESSNNLGQLLSVLGVRDEVVPGAVTHLQLHKERAVRRRRMRTKTWSVRMPTPFILLGTSSILTRICWSGRHTLIRWKLASYLHE